MGDITKLPKWAQSHIRSLESTVRTQAISITELKGENSKRGTGLVVTNSYAMVGESVILPDRETISFKIGNDFVDVSLNHGEQDRVLIYTRYGRMVVNPTSSNCVTIGSDRT